MSTRTQLGVGARKTIMARHQRMPTSKAGYTCAVEPTVVKQITCIEEESIYALVHRTTNWLQSGWCRQPPEILHLTAMCPMATFGRVK